MDELIKLRRQLSQMLDDAAHSMGRVPKSDPFEHGVQVGRYQALSSTIETLNEVVTDDENN